MGNYKKRYNNALHSVLRFISTAAVPFILGALLGAYIQCSGPAGIDSEGIRELNTRTTELQQQLTETTGRLEHAHRVIESNNWRARELTAAMAAELERQLADIGTASDLIGVLRNQIEELSDYYNNPGSVFIIRDSSGNSYTSDELDELLEARRRTER